VIEIRSLDLSCFLKPAAQLASDDDTSINQPMLSDFDTLTLSRLKHFISFQYHNLLPLANAKIWTIDSISSTKEQYYIPFVADHFFTQLRKGELIN